jgi:hypothetical protein
MANTTLRTSPSKYRPPVHVHTDRTFTLCFSFTDTQKVIDTQQLTLHLQHLDTGVTRLTKLPTSHTHAPIHAHTHEHTYTYSHTYTYTYSHTYTYTHLHTHTPQTVHLRCFNTQTAGTPQPPAHILTYTRSSPPANISIVNSSIVHIGPSGLA